MLPKSTSRKHLLAIACTILTITFCHAQTNDIKIENLLPGVPQSTWALPPDSFRAHNIAGFATKMSLNPGETVHFKVNVYDGANFTLKIYRIGYYQGNGARLMADLGSHPGVIQPLGFEEPVTGLLDCDNWSESASWAIPASAVSGLYIARIDRVGTGGGSNHIVFIVRKDGSTSDMILQFPDATWLAYNTYGGNSIYNGTTALPDGHASKVSYNRPFYIGTAISGNFDGRGADWYMNAEYPMIRFLERNGYDVTYTTCENLSENPTQLLSHKIYISVGHDEYISKEQRNAVEAARNAGVNCAFFSGNEFYWKTRWEADQSGDTRRTMVCYKEGLLGQGQLGEKVCGNKCDISSAEWTGLWRTGANYDAGRPESALIGQLSWTELPGAIQVPALYKNLRFWRNATNVSALGTGAVATLAPNSLGYEWDYEQNFTPYPAGRLALSNTTVSGLNHKLSLYRHSSGALVFGAGTIQWSWGLDGAHYGGGINPPVSQDMQQATVNLFADMGAQPTSIMAGLTLATQTTDHTAPASIITSPLAAGNVTARTTVTITGTATDAGGGVVGAIEVSTDGGLTWKQATMGSIAGNVTWSFDWIPNKTGSVTIKVRGTDDSGNMETPGAGTTVNVTSPVCPCTILPADLVPAIPNTNADNQVAEIGVKFRPNVNGLVTGIRFYKHTDNHTLDGPHLINLWTNSGTNIGNATVTGETASGWQQMLFTTPIAVVAGTSYVASYFSPTGHFSKTDNFFTAEYPAGSGWPVQALAMPLNGVMFRGNSSFPNDPSPSGENYFVDIIFETTVTPTATLEGSVLLQGRPAAPHAQWQVPLVVKLFTPGVPTPAATYNILTNTSGQFSIPNVPVGTYHIAVKNAQTLQKVLLSQAVVLGTNTLNFGLLKAGDGNNDNAITIADISLLVPSFNKPPGDPAFNGGVDYNNDGFVTISDISLLIPNFNTTGDPNP